MVRVALIIGSWSVIMLTVAFYMYSRKLWNIQTKELVFSFDKKPATKIMMVL